MTTETKTLQIFKAGRHVAMSGDALNFSESDLQASAEAYDPALHEAPIVVGHPKGDAPAYGWIKSLSFQDGGLEAGPHQVDPQFAEMVAANRFKKISASFYAPSAPQNPVPGVYYLRHVGFLGAQPPAVKGLRTPEFADAEDGVIEFSDAWSDMQNASLWRRMREWIISRFGLDEADKTIPDFSVAALEDAARECAEAEQDDQGDQPASFSESAAPPSNQQKANTVTPEEKAALEAENAALKKDLADANEREKKAAAAARHADNAAFAEGLIKEGRLLPAHKEFMVSFMDHLSADSGVLEFGEGDGRKTTPALDGLRDYLQAQPKLVDFQEHASGAMAKAVDLNDPSAIHAKAVEFQESEKAAGRTVDIATAVQHVMQQA